MIHFFYLQENKPIGTSVLQLSVTDKDAAHNGPPFHFRILTGNDGVWFALDREGLLTSNQMFRRSERTEYVIQVEVRATADSQVMPCVKFYKDAVASTTKQCVIIFKFILA